MKLANELVLKLYNQEITENDVVTILQEKNIGGKSLESAVNTIKRRLAIIMYKTSSKTEKVDVPYKDISKTGKGRVLIVEETQNLAPEKTVEELLEEFERE